MENSKPILLFDGICKLCNNSVRFVLKRDKAKRFRYLSLQSEDGKRMLQQHRISAETDSIILIHKDRVFIESEAVFEICKELPAPWKWLSIFRLFPQALRNGIYQWIARNRYSWFGRQNEVCEIEDYIDG